jgi:hypothetical protein
MLFKLDIKSDQAEKFVLHIDADASNTFYQLHEAIQEACDYDPSQLATFFLADEEWDKGIEIKMFGTKTVHSGSSEELLMKNARLGDVLKEVEDKLIYVFDIYNLKSLYIELNEIGMEKTINAPVIILKKGIAPAQILDKSTEGHLIEKNDTDSQSVFEDLGELEDLNEIYGEMSNLL